MDTFRSSTPILEDVIMASTTIATPAGSFSIIADGKTVLASGFTPDLDELTNLIHPRLRVRIGGDADLDVITDAVSSYFDGDLTAIDIIDVEQQSGAFIDEAWQTLRKVVAGDPVTYTQLAEQAGRPAAIRGAASACARNAAALFVPCHRVIRSDGSLGGYRYGLDVKSWLLAYETAGTHPITAEHATASAR
jgi:methylated-DNA-[protein]-cysteine S-methyltransferase